MFRTILIVILQCAYIFPVFAQNTGTELIDIKANACEKIIEGESKASTRVRATDKATFLAIKKLDMLLADREILHEHDLNVMIYRLVDEYVENLSVNTTKNEENKVCVEISGQINPANIAMVRREFIKDDAPVKEASEDVVSKVAEEVKQEVAIKPNNPESLALLHIQSLEYYNGAKSAKFANTLKKKFADNPYFYLTEDAEIADYVVTPKVLKANVDALDAGHKRLQMVVSLEVKGLGNEPVNEYQNRFVLFGAEENEQKIASRLMTKLLEQAGDGVLRKVEHNEQVKLEKKTIGRTLSE